MVEAIVAAERLEPASAEGTPSGALPRAPSLPWSFKEAAQDFYYHSMRLVGANLLWGVGLIGLYVAWTLWWPAALLLLPLLALPTVGMYRLAALIVRAEAVSFSDGVRAWRTYGLAALAIGVLAVLAVLVFGTNLVGGLQSGDPIGWAFATFAGWGLVAGALFLTCLWPILVDPARSGRGLREAARSAAYLTIAHPLRIGLLTLALLLLLGVSTVAFAAVVSVSVAYSALVASRYVLPAADRLEARLAAR